MVGSIKGQVPGLCKNKQTDTVWGNPSQEKKKEEGGGGGQGQ